MKSFFLIGIFLLVLSIHFPLTNALAEEPIFHIAVIDVSIIEGIQSSVGKEFLFEISISYWNAMSTKQYITLSNYWPPILLAFNIFNSSIIVIMTTTMVDYYLYNNDYESGVTNQTFTKDLYFQNYNGSTIPYGWYNFTHYFGQVLGSNGPYTSIPEGASQY